MTTETLPRATDIPDEAFYCVECGPENVGLDCDLPGHGEFALLSDLPQTPTRMGECPEGCPEYVVRCGHFDGETIWMLEKESWEAVHPDHVTGTGDANYTVSAHSHTLGICGCPDGLWLWRGLDAAFCATREEADAAWERYEAALLGREP